MNRTIKESGLGPTKTSPSRILMRGLNVGRDAFAISIGRYGQFALTLVTLPLIARSLSMEEFGRYAIVTAIYFFGSIFVDWGLSLALAARLHRDDQSVSKIRQDYFLFRVVVLVILCIVAGFLSAGNLGGIGIALIAGGLSSFSEDWVLVSRGMFVRSVSAQWIGRLFYLVVLFVGITILPSAEMVAVALCIGAAVTVLATWVMVGFPGFPVGRDRISRQRALFRLGAPAVAAKSITNSYTGGIAVWLSSFTSVAALASYSSSDRVIRAAQAGMDSVVLALFPRAAGRNAGSNRNAVRDTANLMAIAVAVSTVIAGALWLLAPVVVAILYGDEYPDAPSMMRVAVWILPAAAITSMTTTNIVNARGKTVPLFLIAIVGLVGSVSYVAISWPSVSAEDIVFAVLLGEWSAALVAAFISVYFVWTETEEIQLKWGRK